MRIILLHLSGRAGTGAGGSGKKLLRDILQGLLIALRSFTRSPLLLLFHPVSVSAL